MSVTLREVFEGAGYDFDDLDDLKKVQSLIAEVEELEEIVDQSINYLENRDYEAEREEALADYAISEANGN